MNLDHRYDIKVVNYRFEKDYEYIGRPSPLGNPFPITTHSNRDRVCNEYEDWFYIQVHVVNEPLIINELKRLHKLGKQKGILKLGCACKPKFRCHGDTIKKWLEDNFDYLEMLI